MQEQTRKTEMFKYLRSAERMRVQTERAWVHWQELAAECGIKGGDLSEGIHVAGSWDQHKDDLLIAAADAKTEAERLNEQLQKRQAEIDQFLARVLTHDSPLWRVFWLRFMKDPLGEPMPYRMVASVMTSIHGPGGSTGDNYIYSPKECRRLCKIAVVKLLRAWNETPPEHEEEAKEDEDSNSDKAHQ